MKLIRKNIMRKLEEAAERALFDTPQRAGANVNGYDVKFYDSEAMLNMFHKGAEWQQSNQWISVEDKPLEIRISALFYIPKYNLTVLGFLESDGVAIWCDGSAYFAKDVTHWMHIQIGRAHV